MKILKVVLLMAMPAALAPAQTSPVLKSFQIERALNLSAVQSTLTPNVPANILAGVTSGALELRESMNFTAQSLLVTLNLFAVQAGAALPTPSSTSVTYFNTSTIAVDRVYSVLTPSPALMLVGTVATPVGTLFGNLMGEPAAVSIGYTTDNPPKVINVAVDIAGVAVDYSASAAGALNFETPPTPPVVPGGINIVIVPNTSVYFRQVTLDASGTTGSNPPLSFHWSVVAGSADVAFANKAVATGNMLGLGEYIFKVTVTDAKGNTASQTITVNYY